VMLNAAGRRRGERRDRKRENYASNGTLFHNRISPWDVTQGKLKGVPSISERR
jgi:hypothetical protein